MKRTKIIITLCAAFLLAGCGNKKESQVDKNEQAINYVRDNKNNISQKESQVDEMEQAIAYVRANKNNRKSIVFWSDSNMRENNPDVLQLVDTIYQYHRKEKYDCDEEMKFLDSMTTVFCKFYDRRTKKADVATDALCKVDSVINMIMRCFQKEKESSFDMMLASDVECCVRKIHHYSVLKQINDYWKGEHWELLRAEWMSFKDLERALKDYISNIRSLDESSGYLSSYNRNQFFLGVSNAHTEMYYRDMDYDKGLKSYGLCGVYQKQSADLLVSCMSEYLQTITPEGEEGKSVVSETKALIKKMPQKIQRWYEARNKWVKEVCRDWNRSWMCFSSAQVIIDLSILISTNDDFYGTRLLYDE